MARLFRLLFAIYPDKSLNNSLISKPFFKTVLGNLKRIQVVVL